MAEYIPYDKDKCSKRLRELRKEKELTQKKFAEELHICMYPNDKEFSAIRDNDTAAISQLEIGKKEIQPEKLFAYAHICGTTCDYILGRTDDVLAPIKDDDFRSLSKTIEKATGLTNMAIRALQYTIKNFCKQMFLFKQDERIPLVEDETYRFINHMLENHRFLLSSGLKMYEIQKISKDMRDEQRNQLEAALKYDIVKGFSNMLDLYIAAQPKSKSKSLFGPALQQKSEETTTAPSDTV